MIEHFEFAKRHIDAASKDLWGHDIVKSRVMTALDHTRKATAELTKLLDEMEKES